MLPGPGRKGAEAGLAVLFLASKLQAGDLPGTLLCTAATVGHQACSKEVSPRGGRCSRHKGKRVGPRSRLDRRVPVQPPPSLLNPHFLFCERKSLLGPQNYSVVGSFLQNMTSEPGPGTGRPEDREAPVAWPPEALLAALYLAQIRIPDTATRFPKSCSQTLSQMRSFIK